MSFEPSALDMTLSAAAGNDLALQAELRQAFLVSARRQADLLRRSRCDANWQMAALRLRAIAASFHADELVALATAAVSAAPGEPTVLRSLEAQVTLLERQRPLQSRQ